MNLEEQTDEFIKRLEAKYPGSGRSTAMGASNGAFMLEGGFRFGLYNIDTTDFAGLAAARKAMVLATRVMLPPENVLHLALVIEGDDLRAFGARRDAIRTSEGPEGKANKVRIYLHPTGLYLAQGKDEPSLNPQTQPLGPPLKATQGLFADINHDTDLDPVEIAYVRHLTTLLGTTPLSRLGPQGGVAGGVAINPATVPFDQLATQIQGLGAFYPRATVERYHVALNHLRRKHFVLLTGISGTGKTLLAKAYAYAVLGLPSLNLPAEDFHLIPVRPDWSDPTHLMGFFDAIAGKYRKTPFLRALLRARDNPHRPTLVCLDEMNLAQPEHYFADALSAMETGEALHVHSEAESVDGVPPRIPWPENLYLCGTVNVDETTRPFSPKVLDRANVIDMSEVDIEGFGRDLVAREPDLATSLDASCMSLLKALHKCLATHGLHFGYRTVEEMARYLHMSKAKNLVSNALDVQVDQKVLTKLRGGREQESMLTELKNVLERMPLSRTVVERMQRDLASYDSFQYWT